MRHGSFICRLLVIVAALSLSLSAQSNLPLDPAAGHTDQIWFNASLPIEKRVDALISSMTLEEKVSQMQNHSAAIPRLGVPEYDYWSEGLHGIARSGYATLFPQAIGLAATWDTPLQHDVATVISTEARAKYNQAMRDNLYRIYFGLTIWSPNINIFRDPRWGRGQETYGEDPFLTASMGTAFVSGLQGDDPTYFRAIATPKHFAVHSGPEESRHRFNVNVTPHDLEDTYLPAFRATITQAHADSLMCAYNDVNNVPACASTMLLQQYLRDAWKFQGFVTSDCGAVSDFYTPIGHHYSPDAAHASAAAVKAGTDTSCGNEYASLVSAVHQNLIAESELDTSLRHLFTARFRLGIFDPPSKVAYAKIPFSAVDSPEHRALALKTARESIVLLKNDGTLPFKPSMHRIAVIGPNAASLAAIEGNYNAIPSHPVLPLDGIEAALHGKAVVHYSQGSAYVEGLPVVIPRTALHVGKGSSTEGLHAEYFPSNDLSDTPALIRTDKQIDFDWNSASPAPHLSITNFSVRWTGTISVPAPGSYHFPVQLNRCSPCTEHERYAVWIDGKEVTPVATNSVILNGRTSPRGPSGFDYTFDDTAEHTIRLEYRHVNKFDSAGIILQWIPPADALRQQAVQAAQKSDVVIAFVGLSPTLEGEEMPIHVDGFSGGDRTDIALPQTQQQLLDAVAATGKPVIVVLMSGSAVALNWAQQHAAAVIEAWYPGEAGGEAIADVLTGAANPSGRLPVTFYASTSQLPDFNDYNMQGRTYRYFAGKPLYSFGYGLSYSTFKYSSLKLSADSLTAGQILAASVTVTNISSRAGDEVAELYIVPPQSTSAPLRTLQGFQRIHLAPHSSRVLHFDLTSRNLSTVDADGQRAVRAGIYQLVIAGTQPQDAATSAVVKSFTLTGTDVLPK